MKNLLVILVLAITMQCSAQTTQETITYSVDAGNSPMAAAVGDMKMVLYYKNGKSLFDMTSLVYSVKTLVNDNGTLMLMNVGGQKFYIKQPVPSAESIDSVKPSIDYIDETREIAGYTCKKALVRIPGIADTAVFWYCEQLPVTGYGKDAAILKALKGMPLEYVMTSGPVQVKLTAKTVSTNNIPESTFQLSTEGYTEMDPSMFKGMAQ